MAYLTLLITIPLTVFAVLFAISNDAAVTVGLWPFSGTYELPLFLFGLGMLGGGFFLGALFVWLLSQKTRFKYWQESRRAARLEKELEALHAKAAPAAPKEAATALPAK